MRILWADDQYEVAKTLSLCISGATEHRITFVNDCQKALDALKEKFFDIAILDLAMPPGSWGGLWFLERLKETENRIPVIVLSGEGKQPETIKALRLGARDFITKERASTELSERLTTILRNLWPEIHKEILTSFPSPLALTYKRYSAGSTPQGRMRSLIDMYEQAVRVGGIIGLAEAGECSATAPLQAAMQLGRPSIGTWYEAVRSLHKHLTSAQCLPRFWRAIDEHVVTEVIKTRNDIAHGYEFGERKAELWLSRHEPDLRSWLARLWQQFPFGLFAVLSSAYDGTLLRHNTVTLEGESAVLPKGEVTSKDNLVLHHAYVRRTDREKDTVSLHPLLILEHGEDPGAWRAYLFDGWKANHNLSLVGNEQLRYIELWSGDRTDNLGTAVSSLPRSLW